jgi:nucleotide-binding universal stress UspA family protein
MIKKILVAYDGSKESEKAYILALDMACKYSAQIIVLSVARPSEPPVAVEMEAILEAATDYFQEQFKELKAKAAALGLEPRFEIRAGHPAEQIVHSANEERAEMIVMGHRGGGLMQKFLLGSVARRVMIYAHCTVVVVR